MTDLQTAQTADRSLESLPVDTPSTRRQSVVSAVIGLYLTALSVGLAMHQFDLPGRGTVAGYLVVWDMFCGWSGYERRLEYVAKGESGQYYDAGAVPGRDIEPHGHSSRRHFDFRSDFVVADVENVLRRTTHEPIERVYVVERQWAKRGLSGLPHPPEEHVYTHLTFEPGGPVQAAPSWHRNEVARSFDRPVGDPNAGFRAPALSATGF